MQSFSFKLSKSMNHVCVYASNMRVCVFSIPSLMVDGRGVVAAASSIFKGKVIQALDVLCSVF